MKTVAQMLRAKPRQNVHTIDVAAPMLEALRMMAELNIGALPVTEGGHLVGIVSERDYARKGVLQGRSSVATVVREFMTEPVLTVTSKQSIRECMSLMTEQHMRHLPVVEDGELVGLLSIGDLVKEAMAEQDDLILHLEQYIRGEVA
ncbi:CBS domain-containing protein [Pseudomonas sp. JS3066]|jgi:CBS domain-containing protein|uniref:CBS domain-containing protein n=1 Tax=unclassified Pseudomonas TaxID=196821 RepID=UPI000EAA0C4B|nr:MULTISPECIES: CBS domain-containing protein [unclassified Pseudomonas]AYF89392.1 CBS domain-containing protein [Pseudomonas sp. DY-1]MDH4655919.1 CBS domain-containing protein [Pseudomonas sp. BN606]MRK21457.1 CBS domain-containing protein [Pseudomonas sp. JG-B]WVK93053.1 CBS domain-containing protein [Pseudomonas sp. JS3066]